MYAPKLTYHPEQMDVLTHAITRVQEAWIAALVLVVGGNLGRLPPFELSYAQAVAQFPLQAHLFEDVDPAEWLAQWPAAIPRPQFSNPTRKWFALQFVRVKIQYLIHFKAACAHLRTGIVELGRNVLQFPTSYRFDADLAAVKDTQTQLRTLMSQVSWHQSGLAAAIEATPGAYDVFNRMLLYKAAQPVKQAAAGPAHVDMAIRAAAFAHSVLAGLKSVAQDRHAPLARGALEAVYNAARQSSGYTGALSRAFPDPNVPITLDAALRAVEPLSVGSAKLMRQLGTSLKAAIQATRAASAYQVLAAKLPSASTWAGDAAAVAGESLDALRRAQRMKQAAIADNAARAKVMDSQLEQMKAEQRYMEASAAALARHDARFLTDPSRRHAGRRRTGCARCKKKTVLVLGRQVPCKAGKARHRRCRCAWGRGHRRRRRWRAASARAPALNGASFRCMAYT